MKSGMHLVKKVRVAGTVDYVFRILALARLLISNCGQRKEEVKKTFLALCALRPEIRNPVIHFTVSPDKSDRISEKKERDIAIFFWKELKLLPGWPLAILNITT